jgi:endonuclease/exonuclease/phosphatase (EEP) superfamily protein YafD
MSGTILTFVAVCYWRRFDACAFVTLFPPWCWAIGGLLLAWCCYTRRRRWPSVLLVVGWLAFVALAADAPLSVARSLTPKPDRAGSIRVVSLNCAGSSPAAREVQRLDPDIVLFQESPTFETLQSLAKEMYGSSENLVRGYDPSILARGRVTAVPVPPEFRGNVVHARVELDRRVINVISLRLFPCPVSLEFWSADCWRYYRTNRENRRRQLAKIADYAQLLPADELLVLGGDFNCPPRDAALELLRPWLSDAFVVAGRGWGATIIELAGVPMIRIDQIWTSPQLRAIDAFVDRATGSDHHMTVADLKLPPVRTP